MESCSKINPYLLCPLCRREQDDEIVATQRPQRPQRIQLVVTQSGGLQDISNHELKTIILCFVASFILPLAALIIARLVKIFVII